VVKKKKPKFGKGDLVRHPGVVIYLPLPGCTGKPYKRYVLHKGLYRIKRYVLHKGLYRILKVFVERTKTLLGKRIKKRWAILRTIKKPRGRIRAPLRELTLVRKAAD
jgi:hypothetical protein